MLFNDAESAYTKLHTERSQEGTGGDMDGRDGLTERTLGERVGASPQIQTRDLPNTNRRVAAWAHTLSTGCWW